MATSRSRSRRRRWTGLLPALGRGLATGFRWLVRHPQPFFAGVGLSVIIWSMVVYAQRAEAFRITAVVLPPDIPLELPQPLLGRNVWSVNLAQLSRQLAAQQPVLKELRVIRQLPDTIRVEAVARRPVAQVHGDRWYPVDEDGMVLPDPSVEPHEGLVRLAGLDRGGRAMRPGAVVADPRLPVALRLLGVLTRHPALHGREVIQVNVGDPEQLRFVLAGEMEVRCGSEAELDGHLARLRAALALLAKRRDVAVRYIDLRFPEPVIGAGP